MSKGIFVTATDTEVGKTFVTAIIGKYLKDKGIKVSVFKPFATGCVKQNNKLIAQDAVFLKNFIGLDVLQEEISPYRFELPLSPLSVQMETNIEIDIKEVIQEWENYKKRFDFLLVEGIGGVRVPIINNYYVSDLIGDIGFSCLIVARPNLGTLNHTLLTIEELKRKNVDIMGVVFNYSKPVFESEDVSIRTNKEVIEKESGIPVLAEIPYCEEQLNGLQELHGLHELKQKLKKIIAF